MVSQRQDDAERAGIKSARGFDLPPEVRPTIHVKNRRPEYPWLSRTRAAGGGQPPYKSAAEWTSTL